MMASESMQQRKGFYPFNTEQTVNILGEFGPLVTMFVVNALYDIQTGTWALIISTFLALIMTLVVLGRPPVFPFIAGAVTIGFGVMTLVTGDPMWVQVKVTIFNLLFAVILWVGLAMDRNFFHFVFGKTFPSRVSFCILSFTSRAASAFFVLADQRSSWGGEQRSLARLS